MLGKDEKDRGQQVEDDLLVDALYRASLASRTGYSVAVIMLDVLDCGAPDKVRNRIAIYEGLKFASLPSDPLRVFMPMKVADELRSRVES